MNEPHRLPVHGVVQHYAWGDQLFIPDLLGLEPDGEPWAELWLGTHPNGPTMLDDGRPLAELSGELPYLLKVLAAAEPLSLQTHPNAEQARAGFEAGRYPDPNPKPELLVALTPFTALCGLRPDDDTLALLERIGVQGPLVETLRNGGGGAALDGLYRDTIDPGPVIEACRASGELAARWVVDLDSRYPGEPSVAATLLLNLVELEPGESITLGAGNLHAYLRGAGIELMNASDNVVRGGLTQKPVDVDDLLAVVDPTPLVEPVRPSEPAIDLPGTSIRLLRLDAGTSRIAASHELAVTMDGDTWYLPPGAELTTTSLTFAATTT